MQRTLGNLQGSSFIGRRRLTNAAFHVSRHISVHQLPSRGSFSSKTQHSSLIYAAKSKNNTSKYLFYAKRVPSYREFY